jgi:hypothetical protein
MSMEARAARWAILAAALLSIAARYQTANFVVTARSAEIAEQVGQAAEHYRREIAKEWLGQEMRPWSHACPVKVHITNGAGGVTSFRFERGEVCDWNMTVQGPLDQILHSVLPHEVTHTIFACHFRQPLPRWADEGACSTVEHPNERARQNKMLIEFLREKRGIAFTHMFRMKEYPRDMLPLYAQGHSLATFLLAQGGKQKFLAYLAEGMQHEDWNAATKKFYNFEHLSALQNSWLDWVQKGGPNTISIDPTTIASRDATRKGSVGSASGTRPGENIIYRGQSADPPAKTPGRLGPVSHQETDTPPSSAVGRSDTPSYTADSPGWRPPNVGSPTDRGEFAVDATAPGPGADRVANASSRYIRPPGRNDDARVPGKHLPDAARSAATVPFSLPSSPAPMSCLPGEG